MEKQCCTINVTEMEDGFRVEIKGEGVKEKCQSIMGSCCTGDGLKKFFQSCCGHGQNQGSCC